MPVTHHHIAGNSRLDEFAGYPFARPLRCPTTTRLVLDIPFQRSTHRSQYAPRLIAQSLGVTSTYSLFDGYWVLTSGDAGVIVPLGSSRAPSAAVGTVARVAAN